MTFRLREYEHEISAKEIRRNLTRMRVQRYRLSRGGDRNCMPFLGVDGEGAGKDDQGRQNYLLLRAGARELFRDNKRLSTEDCFEFLLGLPRYCIPVGYFFTYDATQILRDLPAERLRKLFEPKERGPGRSPYTFWREYAIDFRPRQYFRIARLQSRNSTKVVANSARTVNEVGNFFQGAFVKTLLDWEVCEPDILAKIAAGKEDRGNEERTVVTDIEREYCRLEVLMLERLMEKFRLTCMDTGMVPEQWRGPGSIAAALHKANGTPKRKSTQEIRLQTWGHERARKFEWDISNAYFGGRFEVTQVGRIPGPVWEYDINSAYPAAMLKLPCPHHTVWHEFGEEGPPNPWDKDADYVAKVTFSHPFMPSLCGLPIRRRGRLYWPNRGIGSYWSPEIRAQAGLVIDHWHSGFLAERRCDCEPFDWVRELYEFRRQIGKGTRGIALKLGINSLYGKLCQRIGEAPWRDLIAGGLITAHCRAQLSLAYGQQPDSVVMLATDALFSRKRLDLPLSDKLGDWEETERSTGLFIVQPGVYWSPGSDKAPKTRGIPRSRIIERRKVFERIWDRWAGGDEDGSVPPSLVIPLQTFNGHRLALHRNKPELAGSWTQVKKTIRFDWNNKRQWAADARDGLVYTKPYYGSHDPEGESEVYDPRALTGLQEEILEGEAMDDFYPMGNTNE